MSNKENDKILEDLREQLADKKRELETIENNENIEEYRYYLRDVYGENINICGFDYDTPTVFEEVDLTAFRGGYTDFNDNLITELQNEIGEIEEEIKEINK